MKYDKTIAKMICELVASGDYKIADVAKAAGISESTFYKWKTDKSEFSESLKRAEQQRLEVFKHMARSGLAKLLDVHEVEETVTESKLIKGKPQIVGVKKTKRVIMPSATAIIFALKNTDAENWKDKQEVEHSGDVGLTWHEERTYEGEAPAAPAAQ